MPKPSTDLQKKGEELQANKPPDIKEDIRTGGSAVAIISALVLFFSWLGSYSPFLYVPVTAVLFILVFAYIYYHSIKPKIDSLFAENETLRELYEKEREENHSHEKPKELVAKIKNAASQKKTPEQRPSIQTNLVIDSVTARKVEGHIQLENIGKIIVANIRVGIFTNDSKELEIEPFMTRILPPKGKISVPLLENLLKPKKAESLIVKILYSAEINNIEKEFLQTLRFLLYPKDIKVQTIAPEAWEESEGVAHNSANPKVFINDVPEAETRKVSESIETVIPDLLQTIEAYELDKDGIVRLLETMKQTGEKASHLFAQG